MKKVYVIGGGASGLIAALKASKDNDVTILEKNNTLGKKILITGNGKCNYFNDDFTSAHYESNNKELIDEIINTNNKEKLTNLFNELGFVPKIKNGYYYPYSNQAVSIQNVLLNNIKNSNINVLLNTNVLDINYQDNKYYIKTNSETLVGDVLILASGSYAYYNTGLESISYNTLKKFNHNIIKILPGLTKLKLEGNFYKDLDGIRCDARLKLHTDKFIKEEVGELQFTDYGISGICTMQLSNYAVRILEENVSTYITINFLNFLNINTFEEFDNYFNNRSNLLRTNNISELFDTILNYKIINTILKLSKIDSHKKYNELSNNELTNLYNNLINLDVKVIDYTSFKESQICTGGLDISEVNLKTMESNIQKDLYIIGEVLDLAGDCGGYNLSIAFLTGLLAGDNINHS
jgi:predicted Rossmann fold flavoprotein